MKQESITHLHSRYNPQAEAERYIDTLLPNGNIRFFILIEPGFGYMALPLKKKYPQAKLIALHVEEHEKLPSLCGMMDAEWFPKTGIALQDFLEKEIPDTEASGIRLLEWRPALAVYGKAYLDLVEETALFIKRIDANARTIKAFGRRWFRNFFNNLALVKTAIYPASLSMPLLVTGSGPSLEELIPIVRKEPIRSSLFILAAASSAAALEAGGLNADMVISTDGSPWALFHLREIIRSTAHNKKPKLLAAALCAAIPSQCEASQVLLISDGSLWQTLILSGLNIPFFALPQRGTVSATALDLAFALSKGEIYLAGMDLANQDIRSHSRPYSFDRLIEEKAGRLDPAYSQSYKRSSMLKDGGSFNIYASWFEKQLGSYPKRLYSLGKNNPLFSPLETAGPRSESFKIAQAEPVNFKTVALNSGREQAINALEILMGALKDARISPALTEELKLLLGPGTESRAGLINTIYSLFHRGRSYE